jgi:hypothetical protein
MKTWNAFSPKWRKLNRPRRFPLRPLSGERYPARDRLEDAKRPQLELAAHDRDIPGCGSSMEIVFFDLIEDAGALTAVKYKERFQTRSTGLPRDLLHRLDSGFDLVSFRLALGDE